jgi:hypothetical protein
MPLNAHASLTEHTSTTNATPYNGQCTHFLTMIADQTLGTQVDESIVQTIPLDAANWKYKNEGGMLFMSNACKMKMQCILYCLAVLNTHPRRKYNTRLLRKGNQYISGTLIATTAHYVTLLVLTKTLHRMGWYCDCERNRTKHTRPFWTASTGKSTH